MADIVPSTFTWITSLAENSLSRLMLIHTARFSDIFLTLFLVYFASLIIAGCNPPTALPLCVQFCQFSMPRSSQSHSDDLLLVLGMTNNSAKVTFVEQYVDATLLIMLEKKLPTFEPTAASPNELGPFEPT